MKFILMLSILLLSGITLHGQTELISDESSTNNSNYQLYASVGLWDELAQSLYYDFNRSYKLSLGGKMVTKSNWLIDLNVGYEFIQDDLTGVDVEPNYVITKYPSQGITLYTYNRFQPENILTFSLSSGYRVDLADRIYIDLAGGINYNILNGRETEGLSGNIGNSESINFKRIGVQLSAMAAVDLGPVDIGIFGKISDAEWNRIDTFSSIMPSIFYETGVIFLF